MIVLTIIRNIYM